MSIPTQDHSLHLHVIGVSCEEFDAFFQVYGPDPQIYNSVVRMAFGVFVIIIKPLDGHTLDIFERLHGFFLALDWVPVCEPGYVTRAD